MHPRRDAKPSIRFLALSAYPLTNSSALLKRYTLQGLHRLGRLVENVFNGQLTPEIEAELRSSGAAECTDPPGLLVNGLSVSK